MTRFHGFAAVLLVLSQAPAAHAGEAQVLRGVLDMNIVPAVDVELVSAAALSWSSTGTELIAPGPTLRVRSNIPYTLGDVSTAEGGAATNVKITVERKDGREIPAREGRDYGSTVIQTIDYGIPLVIDDSEWRVDIQYTFLPASI